MQNLATVLALIVAAEHFYIMYTRCAFRGIPFSVD